MFLTTLKVFPGLRAVKTKAYRIRHYLYVCSTKEHAKLKNIKEKQKHLIENILLQRIPPDQLHSCHRNLTIIGSGTNRWQEWLHPPLLLTPKIYRYERSLKDDTSYCDKMLHLTKVRSYIFRRTLVHPTFYRFTRHFLFFIN